MDGFEINGFGINIEEMQKLSNFARQAMLLNGSEWMEASKLASKIYTGENQLMNTAIQSMTKHQSYIENIKNTVDSQLNLLTIMGENYPYLKDGINKLAANTLSLFYDAGISSSLMNLSALSNFFHPILNLYESNITEDEKKEINETNEKIITEIFQPDIEKKIDIEESPIITLSPVNEKVLKYLSEHTETLYQLSSREFEKVMAEIYSKLGYDVTLTQATRDGGKDIIIRKPDALGDFIFYVECKKYSPSNTVGLGIVQRFAGTVNADYNGLIN